MARIGRVCNDRHDDFKLADALTDALQSFSKAVSFKICTTTLVAGGIHVPSDNDTVIPTNTAFGQSTSNGICTHEAMIKSWSGMPKAC